MIFHNIHAPSKSSHITFNHIKSSLFCSPWPPLSIYIHFHYQFYRFRLLFPYNVFELSQPILSIMSTIVYASLYFFVLYLILKFVFLLIESWLKNVWAGFYIIFYNIWYFFILNIFLFKSSSECIDKINLFHNLSEFI